MNDDSRSNANRRVLYRDAALADGTADRVLLDALLSLAEQGCADLTRMQAEALEGA